MEVRQYDPYLIAEVTFKKGEAQDMKAALSGGFRAIAGYIFDSKVGSRQHHRLCPAGVHLLHAAGRPDHCKCSLHRISLQHAHPQTVRKTHEINWTDYQGEGQHEEGKEKIAMTSPVTAEMGDDEYKVPARCMHPAAPIAAALPPLACAMAPAMLACCLVVPLWSPDRARHADSARDMTTFCCPQVAFVMPSKYTAQNIPKPKNAKVEIKPVEAHTLAALSFRWANGITLALTQQC